LRAWLDLRPDSRRNLCPAAHRRTTRRLSQRNGTLTDMNNPAPCSIPPAALGYVRVSTDRQELSLEAQTSAIQRAVEYQKLGPATIFAEPDTSGRLPFLEREQGRALIQ